MALWAVVQASIAGRVKLTLQGVKVCAKWTGDGQLSKELRTSEMLQVSHRL